MQESNMAETEINRDDLKYNIPLGFYFSVTFSAVPNGEGIGIKEDDFEVRFQEVSGLTAELGIETYDEGGENRFSHRLPTRAKYNNLVLKRGMLLDSKLRSWFEDAVINFNFKPINVTVNLLNDQENEPISSWHFHGVWPVKWSVSDLKAMENSIVIESAELAYKFFEKKS